MADKLSIYNGALLITGSRKLATLSDNVESRRVLDTVWDGGAFKHCLEKGFWKHAMRDVKLEYESDIEPAWGYNRVYEKPEDLVRLYSLCTDEFFQWPNETYNDSGNFWFTDIDNIYVRYVSNGADYGADTSLWPESFTRFVEAYFAVRAVRRLTEANTDYEECKAIMEEYLAIARSESALKEPSSAPLPTSWQRARAGFNYGTRRDHPYR